MLRRFLLYLSMAGWARALMSHFFLARRVARRFVAGETLEDALNVTRKLKSEGLLVSLDYLGESVNKAEDTAEVVDTYLSLISSIRKERLGSSVSLKLTHLGLDISEDLCINNMRALLTAAKDAEVPVTIDMESSAYTEKTIEVYRRLRDEYGFSNVGTVIQSYLYRSREDMRAFAAEGSHIRLCKGAYLESATVAFAEKADVDEQYREIVDEYIQNPASYLCIATHDEKMIQAAKVSIAKHIVPKTRFEFQMLYGIRSQRQHELSSEGFIVRVYVPFGEAWYPYFMRRLAERPANLWFFAKSLFSS
ncbi:MAG: proline dehydrogenase family protein [Anaerolineae bacterium]|nr:proline dehydrogenase family protein [Chloroflexota bacterium]MBP6297922.1 proline dehydrogenase family protein [Anaerolineae bacterium]